MFDEAARVAASLRTVVGSPLHDGRLELVLVDDGSGDDTVRVVTEVLAELGVSDAQLIRRPVNEGKGAAVRIGLLAARGATRVFVDADLSVGVDDVERCFAALEGGVADVVYGTRAHPASTLDRSQPGYRVLSGRVFNGLLRSLGLTEERDTQCGLKGLTEAAVDTVVAPLVTARFAFDVEVLARAQRAGLRVAGLPVHWSHVEASRVRTVRDGLEMSRAAVRVRRRLDAEAAGRVPRRPAHDGTGAGPMAREAIDAMARVERTHWWFRAKHRLVLEELDRRGSRGPVVDVGAGTGGFLERLVESGRRALGVELDEVALAHAAARRPRPLLARSVAEQVPLRSGGAAVATALDVVEHLDDDVAALGELARLVGPGGLVVVAVPAHRWAWSDHDVRLGHRRRYDRGQITAAAAAAGLEVLRVTHFHSWLAPVAWLVRKTPVRHLVGPSPAEEASMGNAAVNRALQAVTAAERALLRRADLPFGLSILLVARGRAEGALSGGGGAGPASPSGPGRPTR